MGNIPIHQHCRVSLTVKELGRKVVLVDPLEAERVGPNGQRNRHSERQWKTPFDATKRGFQPALSLLPGRRIAPRGEPYLDHAIAWSFGLALPDTHQSFLSRDLRLRILDDRASKFASCPAVSIGETENLPLGLLYNFLCFSTLPWCPTTLCM